MKNSPTLFHECLLLDSGRLCGTDTHRDIVTMKRRVEHEGMAFLTITLPAFCQDFERSLDAGRVGPSTFLGFGKWKALPRFLGGLLSQVFDRGTGDLLDEPSLDAIRSIRQVCLVRKKVFAVCDPVREARSFEGYVECERELGDHWLSVAARLPREHEAYDYESYCYSPYAMTASQQRSWDTFGWVADRLWGRVLQRSESSVFMRDMVPRHGPGSTAERITGNRKYVLNRWTHRLQEHFPFDLFGVSSLNGLDELDLESVQFDEPGAELPVRVISVPKTQKAARIIAMEPVCMQYAQQALCREIVNDLEAHPMTAGRINFTDQTINRKLALEGSIDGHMATVDLKDASDRVHSKLVWRMLQAVPNLRDAVFACRSTRADVGGQILRLHKFASMGSALCFPMEAMAFFTTIVSGRLQRLRLPVTLKGLSMALQDLYVYGDDIIVPANEVPDVASDLEAFGLKVSHHKTFGVGRFRESCGLDAYAGVDVTPVYARFECPSSMRDVRAVVSSVSFANQLYRAGWWETARRVREVVERVTGRLPHVLETSPALGWYSFLGTVSVQRWNRDLHGFEVKSLVVKPRSTVDVLDGYGALLKFFLNRRGLPLRQGDFSHVVRRGHATLKVRWVRAC